MSRKVEGFLVLKGKLFLCNCDDGRVAVRRRDCLKELMPRLNIEIEYHRFEIISVDDITGKVTECKPEEGCSLWLKP